MTNKVGDTNASWCGKNREEKKVFHTYLIYL